MDYLDRALIAALRADGRAAVSDLAADLKVTRATIRARLDRLENSGAIVGYTVVLKEDVEVSPVRGLMMIAIAGRGTSKILRVLQGMPEVRALHSTNGQWDAIAEVGVDTLERFDRTLNRIREIDGVTGSETSLLLSTKKRA